MEQPGTRPTRGSGAARPGRTAPGRTAPGRTAPDRTSQGRGRAGSRRSWGSPPVPRTARPDRSREPVRTPRSLAQRLRLAAVVASALVLLVTGTSWGLYRDLTAGITTTDVIAAGGNGGDQHILLVGVDSRTDARGEPLPPEVLAELNSGSEAGLLNSDTIILLYVPEDGGRATAFSLPRDAYVDIPGYRRDKLNAAYPATVELTAQRLVDEGEQNRDVIDERSLQEGRSALIQAVEGLTGVTVDHYAEINLFGFHTLTTAIGGVDVCLNAAVDDELSGARFAAGPQTIAGSDALAFVRQRYGLPEGDLSRIRRQQVFLAAVVDKILSSGTLSSPSALGSLIEVAQRSLVIDDGWDLLAFARQAAGIAAGDIEFVTIPTEGMESNARGDVLLVDRFAVRAFVEQHVQAEPEPVPPPAPEPPIEIEIDPGRYVVDVQNASGTAGLAAQVSSGLGAAGFTRGSVGNTESGDSSIVRHNDSEQAARVVAARLGGLDVAADSAVPRGHVVVTLGTGFTPPATMAAVRSAGTAGTAAPTDGPITAAGVPCID